MKQLLPTSFIGLCITALPFLAYSQQLPEVTPPTPDASSLFKFLDYPVNYSTGIPQIGIPLYEVRSGSITLPITLNYHSSGRKVTDETGAVGLGWTLSAGGMISRTMYGEADDNDNFIKFPVPWKKQADIDPTSAAGADFLEGIMSTSYPMTWYDTEYDYFSYSANSISGKFVLRDENNIKTPVLIPKKPYKVEYHQATAQYNINYFDYINITDDKGTLYRFGKSLKDGTEYHETSYGSAIGKTGWMLTEIVSPDKRDTIAFKYQHFVKNKRTISQKTIVTDMRGDCYYGGDSQPSSTYEYAEHDQLGTAQDQTFGVQRLVEIKFRNGTIYFNLYPSSDMIASIEIRNSNDQTIRVIEFSQSTQDALSDGNAPTKKLDSLSITDQNNTLTEKYSFEYYQTVYSNSTVVDVRFRDLWGYYNASGQLMMRPVVENVACSNFVGTDYITIGDPTAIRTPSLPGTTSGVLKKIVFPTGGTREFIYEQNKYWDSGTSKLCGGLRLSQTVTNDGSGNVLYKTYKYGLGESGYGTLSFSPQLSNMFSETKFLSYYEDGGVWHADISYRQRTYYADVMPIFGEFHNRPVYYEEVAEYYGTPTSNVGKTIYKYDKGNLFSTPNSVQALFANNDLQDWKENSLIERTEYKRENNSYVRVKKTSNNYQETVYPEEKVWGLHVGKFFLKSPLYVTDPVTGQTVPTYRYLSNCGPDNLDVFQFADYTISIGKKELIRTVDSLFFANGQTLSTLTDYTYDLNHLPSTIAVRASDNDTLVTKNKYPNDFSGTAVYTEMVNRNMLNYVIEESKYRNSTFLSSLKTQYRDWGNNIIKPDTVSTRTSPAPYEPRLIFHAYDGSGNIACVSKDNGTKISYLYSFRNELPVAEVRNAAPKDIFYTSFEETGGNSSAGDAKTGIKSHTGGYGNTLTGLTIGTYKLTYFQKVSGVWNPVQVTNIAVSEGTYSISLVGQVDEVRFYPQNAFMKTYAYIPLKGVISVSDENSITTYYGYDELNRLSTISDDKGNIVKKYSYHYKAQ